MRLPAASSATLALKSALHRTKISDFTVDALGKVSPSFAFHALSYSLVADTCINCGQCEELCPMDIPNALFIHSFAVELQELYGYQAGKDLSIPNIAPMEIILREKDRKNQSSGEGGKFSLSTSPDKLLQE